MTLTKGETFHTSQTHRKKASVKLIFWLVVSIALFSYVIHSYTSGQMVRWYYYKASTDGYAVNANTLVAATKQNPVQLSIVKTDTITGLQAVPVKKGDRLPEYANGVITPANLKSGRRVTMDAASNTLKVIMGFEIKEAKGFKYKDSFKHKGIQTNPWSGVWNVSVVLLLGLALGKLAEGFTDVMGMKIEKIDHAVAH